MKETTKMSRAVSQLEHIYNSLNTDFFSAELPVPIITVQSKPGTYGRAARVHAAAAACGTPHQAPCASPGLCALDY